MFGQLDQLKYDHLVDALTVQPGTYDITLQRRASFSLGLQFKDDQDVPIDLTGATVVSQAWDEARYEKYADFSVVYTNRLNGQVSLNLTANETENFPNVLYYDVLIEEANGDKNYYLEG